MKGVDSRRDDIVIPATDGARVFENDLGGISIEQTGDQPSDVSLSVDEARRVAEALLRLANRIEAERARYAEVCERALRKQRIQRASTP